MTVQRRMTWIGLMLAAGLVLALWAAQTSRAVPGDCTDTWDGSTADWAANSGSHWSNGLPDTSSIVCIPSGQVTVSTGQTVAKLEISGAGTKVIVSGVNLYTDDPNTGDPVDGPMSVDSGATLQGTGSPTGADIQGARLDNAGTVEMSGGSQDLRFPTFMNSGTFAVDTNLDLDVPSTLTNTGTINVAAGQSLTASIAALTLNQNAGQITGGAGSSVQITGGAINHIGGNVDPAVAVGIKGGSINPSGTGTAAYQVGFGQSTSLDGNVASGITLTVRGQALALSADRTNDGTIAMAGAGFNGGTLAVGTHTLTNNGTLHAQADDFAPSITGSNGTLTNSSTGSVTLDEDTSIQPTMTSAGAVSITDPKTATFAHTYTQTAGTTSGHGNISGNVALQGGVFSLGGAGGSIDGNLDNTGGNVSPCGEGTICQLELTGSGNYTQGAGGTLTEDVGGVNNHDFLLVQNGPSGTNNVSIAGTLAVDSTGFTPASNDQVILMESDGHLTGTFDTFTQVGGGGRTYVVNYRKRPALDSAPIDRFSLTVVPQFNLTAAKAGNGSGTVTSNPAGINCGSTCTKAYDTGTSVTLSAAPATGSTFTGWSGEGCSGTGTCTVTTDQARSVTATFTLNQFGLTVAKAGNGSGSVSSTPAGIDCGATCAHNFDYGTSVTLTATPATGSTFTGWSGAGCSGTGTCTVSTTEARSVTATFTLSQFSLSVAKAGNGSGSVSSSPSGIACGATCVHAYDYGTSVTLTAAAATGSTFAGWSGACSGTGTCTVSMTQARTVTATFNKVATPDRTPPVASGLTVTPATFRAASAGGSTAAARPIGTTVRYRLSEAARVKFTVQRVAAGRKVGKNCVAPTKGNRNKPRCTRYLAVRGSFTQTGRAGANRFKFTGRLSGVKLKPGVYRLSVVPTDTAGNRGRVVTVRFTIVR